MKKTSKSSLLSTPKKAKKVAFVAFSDIQIEDWKQHSKDHSRLYDNQAILKEIQRVRLKYECPTLFGGDLFDNPKYLTNLVLRESVKWLSCFSPALPLLGIPGNHDQCERNTRKHTSPNYLQTMEYIFPEAVVDVSYKPTVYGDYIITGIPYITANDEFEVLVKEAKKAVADRKEKKILLIHSDLPGAIDPSGREIGSSNLTWKLSKLFKGFDLVLSGHIHKPQVIRKLNPTIIMMGATHQQRVTDSGTKMGYWLIFDDLTYEFVHLKKIPRFIYLKEGEEPEGNNFYIEEKKPIFIEGKGISENFKTSNPKKLAVSYMKVKKIKSKAKRKLLIKYLDNAT